MLELEHIQKAFDGVPVLKDLSLQVEDGEIVSILGPSGCGKTTLLNIILGIVDADQGEIRYSGEDLTRTPMEKRGFNIVFLRPLSQFKRIAEHHLRPAEQARHLLSGGGG